MVTVPSTRTFTPQQFARLCALHPEEVLELDADGHLIEMAPTGSETSARNQVLGALLWLAVRQRQLPFKVFDNSGSFLPKRLGAAPLFPRLAVELDEICAA